MIGKVNEKRHQEDKCVIGRCLSFGACFVVWCGVVCLILSSISEAEAYAKH